LTGPGEPFERWLAGGERLAVTLPAGGGSTFEVFCRVQGTGPWLTLLHGFPTSSWDWAKVADRLAQDFRLLIFDFLGFGDSDKPAGHAYSLLEQADLTEALWRRFEVRQSGLVAHDYGATVAAELLARAAEGALDTGLSGVLFLNAGLYVDAMHPASLQRLLRQPLVGRSLRFVLGRRAFERQFGAVFSAEHPIAPDELAGHWQAITRHHGLKAYHRLVRYLGERKRYQARWEGAVERPAAPTRYVWGLDDPVSGRDVLARLQERVPAADVVALAGVGHYPQLEVPDRVAAEILGWAALREAPPRPA
jgi:pimeloyl-ACP methyl ester carboxylesterase